jgi:hypothetical protein
VDANVSRNGYIVSLMPRTAIVGLGLDARLLRRRYCLFTPLPTRPAKGLLIDNGDQAGTAVAFAVLTGSGAEFGQWQRFHDPRSTFAQWLFPTVREPLRSQEHVRELAADDELWQSTLPEAVGLQLPARLFLAEKTLSGR